MNKLNSKNHGSLFQGWTWNAIFGILGGEKDPETWIEPVYVHAPLFSEKPLMVDHYNLCGYGNHREYRNKIPKELNSYIQEHLSHLIEG
jgi:hypothetical protein